MILWQNKTTGTVILKSSQDFLYFMFFFKDNEIEIAVKIGSFYKVFHLKVKGE